MSGNVAVKALMDSGADAMSNMYEVYLTFPGSAEAQILTVRAEGFKIPEAETATYDKKYHGHGIKAFKTEVNYERKFDMTFRMDAAYNLHESFEKWHAYSGNHVTGGVSNVAGATGKVVVRALNSTYVATDDSNYGVLAKMESYESSNPAGSLKTDASLQTWTFDDVAVTKVGQPEFKTDSADALKFTVSFIFGQTDYPGYNDMAS